MNVRRGLPAALPLVACAGLFMHMFSAPVAMAQTELSFVDCQELCETKMSSINTDLTPLGGFCSKLSLIHI